MANYSGSFACLPDAKGGQKRCLLGTCFLLRLMQCLVLLKQEGRLDAGVRGRHVILAA